MTSLSIQKIFKLKNFKDKLFQFSSFQIFLLVLLVIGQMGIKTGFQKEPKTPKSIIIKGKVVFNITECN